jgi:hypothetical protein
MISAVAQGQRPRVDVFAGIQGGFQTDAPYGFAQSICARSERLSGVHVRLHALRILAIALEHSGHDARGAICPEAPQPPVRDVGPDQRSRDIFPSAIPGYPYGATTARLELEPAPAGFILRPLVTAGVGRMWSKHVTFVSYGAGIVGEVSRLRIFGRWTRNAFSFPYETITEHYFDGKLVSTERTSSNSAERHNAFEVGADVRLVSIR